jgi:sulfide:quinone oxidoreductase
VVVGGGTGGVGISAQLKREGETDITIIEPSDVHYYQVHLPAQSV